MRRGHSRFPGFAREVEWQLSHAAFSLVPRYPFESCRFGDSTICEITAASEPSSHKSEENSVRSVIISSGRPRRRFLLLILISVLVPSSGNGQVEPIPRLHSSEQVSEILIRLLTYSSVARACEHTKPHYDLKATLVQALELLNRKGGFTSEGKSLYRDPETYLRRGAAEYLRHPYVTCGQAFTYYSTILDYSREFIRGNS